MIATERARSAAVGRDDGAWCAREVSLAWVEEKDGEARIFDARAHLEYGPPDSFGEPYVGAPQVAGAGATDVMVPWASFDRKEGLLNWLAWREGSALCARASTEDAPRRIDLGAPPRRLLRPALMGPDGALDVFAVLADGEAGEALARVRFAPPDGSGQAGPPRILWRAPLPGPSLGGRCAIGPEGAEARHVAVAVPGSRGGVAFIHSAAEDEDAARRAAPIEIDAGRPLADADPALRIEADGTVLLAVLVETFGPGATYDFVRRLAVAEVRRSPDGTTGPVKVRALAALERLPVAATAAFSVGDGPVRIEWAALLESGTLLCSTAPPGRPPAPPAVPLELLPLAGATYLLTLGSDEEPPGLALLA